MHSMSSAEIDTLFDVLVETCGTAPETRYAFVQSIERQLARPATGSTGPASFRFGGYLGPGARSSSPTTGSWSPRSTRTRGCTP
jgi:hypothetical protein